MANDERGKKPVVHTKKHIARLERERRQTRIIFYVFLGILVTVVGLIVYGYLDINYLQLRRPVAKVGKNEILASQFEARVRLRRQQLLINYNQYQQYSQFFGMDVSQQLQQITTSLSAPVDLGQTVLDQMIDEELIRQEAAKRGITLSKEDVDKAVKDAFGFYPNGTSTPTITPTTVVFPTIPPQAFEIVTITPTPTVELTVTVTTTPTLEVSATPVITGTVIEPASPTPTVTLAPTETPTLSLTATPNPTATPYTLQGFQADYKNSLNGFQKLGLTEADYQTLFESQLLRPKLMDVITADVPHVEDQVWARHILVKDEATAQAVIKRLKAGEDFAKVAAEVSTDTGTASKGGDLGWFGKGVMVAPFEAVAFKLKPGEISDPVKSDFGYHVIQVIAHQERPLSSDQYDQARTTEFDNWLKKARDDYKVTTFDFWKQRVPILPSFDSMATDAANSANTAQAKDATSAAATTPTPTPK